MIPQHSAPRRQAGVGAAASGPGGRHGSGPRGAAPCSLPFPDSLCAAVPTWQARARPVAPVGAGGEGPEGGARTRDGRYAVGLAAGRFARPLDCRPRRHPADRLRRTVRPDGHGDWSCGGGSPCAAAAGPGRTGSSPPPRPRCGWCAAAPSWRRRPPALGRRGDGGLPGAASSSPGPRPGGPTPGPTSAWSSRRCAVPRLGSTPYASRRPWPWPSPSSTRRAGTRGGRGPSAGQQLRGLGEGETGPLRHSGTGDPAEGGRGPHPAAGLAVGSGQRRRRRVAGARFGARRRPRGPGRLRRRPSRPSRCAGRAGPCCWGPFRSRTGPGC